MRTKQEHLKPSSGPLRSPSGPSVESEKEETVCKHVMRRYTTQQHLETECTIKNTTSKPVKQAGRRHKNM